MYSYLQLAVSPYPNSVLSAGPLAAIAVVAVLSLAVWLILVFAAAREPRHHDVAVTTSLPRPREQEPEQSPRKAA